jgi:hypothetical protein
MVFFTASGWPGRSDGQIPFSEGRDTRGRETCIVPIVGAEGEGLIVKVATAENYAQLALYEDQGVPFRQIDGLGEEAFILNDADLNVLLADGTAVQVAVQAFFVSGSPPDPSTIEPGLVAVAEAVIASR